MMPGTVCSTTHGSREDGMFCSSSSDHVGRDRLRLGLDDRRVRDDVHLLGDAADAERDRERHDRAGADRHVVVLVVGEARELGRHEIAPGCEVEEVRLARASVTAYGGLGPGRFDGHAGQHRAGAVLDGDVDTSREDLRRGGAAVMTTATHARTGHRASASHLRSSPLRRTTVPSQPRAQRRPVDNPAARVA